MRLAHADSSHFAKFIRFPSQSKLILVFTLIGNLVALFKLSIISNALHSFIRSPAQCQLFTTFFAGHHIFTSIQATLYLSMIFAAFAKFSGSFQNICTISGFSMSVCGKTESASIFE